MALDTRIALGVQPVQQQPNMLAQYAQVMGIKAAQQEMEGSEDVRRYFSSPADQRGDISQIMHTKGGRAASETLSQNAQRDLKMQLDALGAAKANVYMAKDPAALVEYMKGVYSSPAGKLLSTFVPIDKALAAIPTDPVAFKQYQENFGLTADQIVTNVTKKRGQNMTYGATVRGQDLLNAREIEKRDYERANPTQYFFTDNSGNLNRVSTRGTGSAAPVPMAGSGAPPQFTIGGGSVAPMGGGTAPMVGGSSIMNPSSVNAFALNSPNALINPPQSTTGVNYAQVRQPPSPITNVNNYVPASETAQTEFMKGSRATFDQLKQASTVLNNIEKAKALIPAAKGFMGTGGETMLEAAKFLNNRLGTSIDLAGVKSAEELNTRAFMGILDNLKKLDSQPSQSQQAALKQALGSLSTDPSAMSAVLDVFGDIVRNKVDIYNQEVTGAEERGIKFPYNPVIKLPPKGATASPPVYATNGKERIMSTDGGLTWQPAREQK